MKPKNHRPGEFPLDGMRATRAPEALRAKTLAAARRAFAEAGAQPETRHDGGAFDRWVERLWGSWLFHTGWVVASLLLAALWQPIALTPGPALPQIEAAQSATPWAGVPREDAWRFIEEEGLL